MTVTFALGLGGCAVDPRDVGREPHMSPVGSGLNSFEDEIPLGATKIAAPARGMRYEEARVNMFRDVRAMTVGDVVTINIVMDDRAVLGNMTDRSRDSKVKAKWTYLLDFIPALFSGPKFNASGSVSNDIESNTSTQGQGSINRSEQMRLSVAAVITAVLPPGPARIAGDPSELRAARVEHRGHRSPA